MNLDWLDAFLLFGLFTVVMYAGLGLLLHLQLGLARIANFGLGDTVVRLRLEVLVVQDRWLVGLGSDRQVVDDACAHHDP